VTQLDQDELQQKDEANKPWVKAWKKAVKRGRTRKRSIKE
jgi:hypothetical protein